jgi:hypothetical protein
VLNGIGSGDVTGDVKQEYGSPQPPYNAEGYEPIPFNTTPARPNTGTPDTSMAGTYDQPIQ